MLLMACLAPRESQAQTRSYDARLYAVDRSRDELILRQYRPVRRTIRLPVNRFWVDRARGVLESARMGGKVVIVTVSSGRIYGVTQWDRGRAERYIVYKYSED